MKRLFVVNPNAGRGRSLRLWEKLSAELNRRQIQYDTHMTKAPGEAVSFLKSTAHKYDLVVALGGDGTVHEVVNGIFDSGAKLGIVPGGTGNDFAHFLGWDPESADRNETVERILEGRTIPIDLVRMKDRVFINVAGMGFDADVANYINQSSVLKKIGAFGYVASVFRTLPFYRPGSVEVEVDGVSHRFENTWLIAAGNAVSYGGGMKILPDADYRDGLLDICIVSNISRLEIMRVFPKVFTGGHVTHPAVTILRGKKVRVETKQPLYIHADGEVIGQATDEIFEILPNRIELLV